MTSFLLKYLASKFILLSSKILCFLMIYSFFSLLLRSFGPRILIRCTTATSLAVDVARQIRHWLSHFTASSLIHRLFVHSNPFWMLNFHQQFDSSLSVTPLAAEVSHQIPVGFFEFMIFMSNFPFFSSVIFQRPRHWFIS